jgi:hypothetical protein
VSAEGQGSVAKAGILGGLLGALLIATPFLNALNFCCCALVIACGAFSAWMLRSDSGGAASTGRCAAAGLLSGVVAALVGVPLGAFLSRAAFGAARLEAQVAEMLEVLRQSMEGSGQPLPPGFMEAFESGLRATSGLEMNGWLVASAIFSAGVHGLFGLLGGILGALMTRRAPPPPPPPPPAAPVAEPPPPSTLPPWPAEGGADGAAPPAATERPGPPVLDENGQPTVEWSGPVLDDAETQPAAQGRGEIPADELPFLPRRDDPDDRQG